MLMRTGGSPGARATAVTLLLQELQTPRNITQGNEVNVSLFFATHRRAGYKSRPHEEHLAQRSSSDTPVVVMEPTEYGNCMDASLCRERPWNRLLVPETLVRTRFIVEAHVLGDDAPEVILTEDEDMVEQLSAERADEAFSEGIHVRRAYRRAHDAHPRRPEYTSEARSELRVVVTDDNLSVANIHPRAGSTAALPS